MRILLSMYSPTAYGAGKVVAQYADALCVAGHHVGLIFDQSVEALGTTHHSILGDLAESGVEVLEAPGLTSWKTFVRPETCPSVSGFCPDLIVATQLRDAPAISRVAQRIGIPFVMLVQNPPRFQGGALVARLKRSIYLAAVERAILGICVSAEIEDELGKLTATRLVTVLNAVDAGPAPGVQRDNALRRALEIGEDDVLLISIARIHPQKGLHVLFDALELLPELEHSFVFLLVGSARDDQRDLEAELRRRAKQMDAVVVMAGFRTDVRELLEASDVFVLSSLFEGGPSLAALEAMAAGLPAVLSDHGARLKGFVDGVHGDYFPVSDSAALAALLVQYVEMESSERESRGRLAREYVLERRSLVNARAEFVSHIEKICR